MMSPTYGSSDKNQSPSMADHHASRPDEQQQVSLAQIEHLQRENKRLVEQLKEVIKMNTHWQRYDSQREEYVVKLTRTNQELQDKVSDLQHQLEEVNIAGETEFKKHKPKLKEGNGKGSNRSGDDRPQELQAFNCLQEEEIAALTENIAELKDKISELEKGRESRKKEDDDQLALLREQVNVCVEDFKQERRDRERIHSDNEKLRERLAKVEQDIMKKDEQLLVYREQIEQLQESQHQIYPASKIPQPNAQPGYDEPCCYPEGRPHRHRVPRQRGKTYRHPMQLGYDLTDLPNQVEIDGGDLTTDEMKAFDQVDGEKDRVETLQCPRCLTPFGFNNHTDLLNHIDSCLE